MENFFLVFFFPNSRNILGFCYIGVSPVKDVYFVCCLEAMCMCKDIRDVIYGG